MSGMTAAQKAHRRAYLKERREMFIMLGICPKCKTRRLKKDETRCEECRALGREYQRAWMNREGNRERFNQLQYKYARERREKEVQWN